MIVSHFKESTRLRAATTTATLVAAILVGALPGVVSADQVDHGSSAECRYQTVSTDSHGTNWSLLRRIVVAPPTLYGVWSNASQPVGWRFVVYRSYRYWDGRPWKAYYYSPLQRGTASESQAANFTQMSVRIAAPISRRQLSTAYRVEVRMLWWYPEQSLLHSKIRYLIPNMREFFDGAQYNALVMPCYYREPNPIA